METTRSRCPACGEPVCWHAGNRPPKVHWVVETGSAVMGASPPGAHIRAEAETMNSSRVTIRDMRPNHGHAHIADVTVWASGPEPLTEETIAVASAIYWSWWRAMDMHGEPGGVCSQCRCLYEREEASCPSNGSQ